MQEVFASIAYVDDTGIPKNLPIKVSNHQHPIQLGWNYAPFRPS